METARSPRERTGSNLQLIPENLNEPGLGLVRGASWTGPGSKFSAFGIGKACDWLDTHFNINSA
jgi:hypothetical protein